MTDSKVQVPSLRAALWLYLFVSVAIAAIVIPTTGKISLVFVRLSTHLLMVLGFTFVATLLNRIKLISIIGAPPTPLDLSLAFFAGLAIGVSGWWLFFVVNGLMNTAFFGTLPRDLISQTEPFAQILQAAIIIPLCQGFMFWMFIQHSASSLSKNRTALLTAGLFGLFGLFSTGDGLSVVPTLLCVGILAAFLVRYTGSAWTGVAAASGYGMSRLLVENVLISFLGNQRFDVFGARWLILVILGVFLAFVLFQVIKVRSTVEPLQKSSKPAKQARWWVPALLIIVLTLLLVSNEVEVRRAHPPEFPPQEIVPTPIGGSGSTLPPQ